MGFEGARKRFSCKGGGAVKRIWSVRGGGTENNYTFKCCNEGFCNSKKNCQNAQNNIP